jgi:hypothetical protein
MNEEIITGKPIDIIACLMNADKDTLWDLSAHKDKKKRSLDSNAFFHALCDRLRQKLGISMARCKNHLIADYGQILYLSEGEPLIYKTNAPEDYMMELESIHTKCVKVTKENGKDVFFYRVYRGSHEYNSFEMNTLIKGTMAECEAQGIPTATPDEIAHMAMLWEQKYERKNQGNINTTQGA